MSDEITNLTEPTEKPKVLSVLIVQIFCAKELSLLDWMWVVVPLSVQIGGGIELTTYRLYVGGCQGRSQLFEEL